VTAIAALPPERAGLAGSIRAAIRLAAMLTLLLLCVPLYYVWHLLRLHNPWPRFFLTGIARIAGVSIKVEGPQPPTGAFLIANHVSWIDIPALSAAAGAAFVGHDGLASLPLLRHLCEMNDTVFVARHDRASVHAQVEDVRKALRETGALAIFPEGTTSDGTGLLPFKSSLLSALEPVPEGIAVVPVLLDYGPDAAAMAWVGDEHGVTNFRRILARSRPVPVTVRFLPPLQGDQTRDRKAMAAAAREAILSAFPRA